MTTTRFTEYKHTPAYDCDRGGGQSGAYVRAEVAERLLAALKQIVADWDSVPVNLQVPDAINEDRHWDAARAAIRNAENPAPRPTA
jgi:hypothetical protein